MRPQHAIAHLRVLVGNRRGEALGVETGVECFANRARGGFGGVERGWGDNDHGAEQENELPH
jgi:hypothetical protein